jgi:hypothetical protein
LHWLGITSIVKAMKQIGNYPAAIFSLSGKYSDKVVLISPEDYDYLSQSKWGFMAGRRRGYVCGAGNRLMHREVLSRVLGRELESGELVDHINGDKLDNRRENLRLATASQNAANSGPHLDNRSGVKGVWLNRPTGKWRAAIRVRGKRIGLGTYSTLSEAAKAYNIAASVHQGAYAQAWSSR